MLTPFPLRLIAPILAILSLATPPLLAATTAPDNSLEARANRFFDYHEWISAGALYTMLTEQRPSNPTFYSRAIVAAGMLADSLQQTTLTRKAFDSRIPVDSLFTAVERTSFSIGQTSLYEDYLILTRTHEPWLSRIIDSYLLRYYTFRRDAPGMIAYSRIMLSGNPDSETFLYTLAQGQLIAGQIDDAMNTYRTIIQLNPRSFDALLYLANYYLESSASDHTAAIESLTLFQQASHIKSTPYIDQAITRLQSRIHPSAP